MITCAIYPRKSKENENSDSMALQVESCEKYINDKYGKNNIRICLYDADYGFTGHSMKRRKDFLRLMNDVRMKRINVVVIMRYDRIARNMRDFCNIFHELEENGCELVSVSQQIDTSTPYGKNFMYQMASMAELEWALTSERYKDMHRYKIEHGLAYTGKMPRFGFKLEKTAEGKKFVHDREEETRDIFNYFLKTKSKNAVTRYVKAMYDPAFTRKMFESMVHSDLYIGKVRNNENFCEPYFTKEYMEQIRSLNGVKQAPSGRKYLFSGLVICPDCKCVCAANHAKGHIYYRCTRGSHTKHKHYAISEQYVEDVLLTHLEAYLDHYIVSVDKISMQEKNSKLKEIEDIKEAMKRIDHLFEKGRLSESDYDIKLNQLEEEMQEAKNAIHSGKEIVSKDIIVEGWKEDYKKLTIENKGIFWHNVITKMCFNRDKSIDFINFT